MRRVLQLFAAVRARAADDVNGKFIIVRMKWAFAQSGRGKGAVSNCAECREQWENGLLLVSAHIIGAYVVGLPIMAVIMLFLNYLCVVSLGACVCVCIHLPPIPSALLNCTCDLDLVWCNVALFSDELRNHNGNSNNHSHRLQKQQLCSIKLAYICTTSRRLATPLTITNLSIQSFQNWINQHSDRSQWLFRSFE